MTIEMIIDALKVWGVIDYIHKKTLAIEEKLQAEF